LGGSNPGPKNERMKILIATDHSQCAHAALQSVAARPWPGHSEFKVLHVIERLPLLLGRELTTNDQAIEAVWSARQDEAKGLVEKAAEKLRREGLNVTTALVEGDPKSQIIDVARDWHADLIVLGSHGWKGLYRFTMGSVSEAVVRHAHCSVEIVRKHA
jgi:nucleotide-binding universal stress UspA family protein